MDLDYKQQYERLGLNVAYYRKLRKYSQMEFAEMVNIDRSYISKVELGNTGVSLDVIFKICEKLEIDIVKLFDFRE